MTLIEGIAAIIMVFAAIREYLTSSGYYEYADQKWPISKSIYPAGDFSSTVINQGWSSLFQFTRDIVDWPYLLFNAILPTSADVEKAFITYAFALVAIGCFLVSELIVRLCEDIYKTRFSSFFKREGMKVAIAFMLFANPWLAQVNVDGGPWTDSLIFLGLVAQITIFARQKIEWKWVISCGILTSISLLLDPLWYPFEIFAIGMIVLVRMVLAGDIRRQLVRYCAYVLVSLPVLSFIELAINATFVPSYPFLAASGMSVGQVYRTIPLNSSAWIFNNMNIWTAISTTGYVWATYTLAPPTIGLYSSQISTVPFWGSPTVFLFPSGIVTTVWVASLFAIPITAFAALLLRPRDSTTISLALLALIGLYLCLYPLSPVSVNAFTDLASLPIVGPSIGEVLAIPYRFFFIVDGAYAIMIPLTLCGILFKFQGTIAQVSNTTDSSSAENLEQSPGAKITSDGHVPSSSQESRSEKRSSIGHTFPRLSILHSTRVHGRARQVRNAIAPCVAIMAVAFILFSGWQSFNGSYYPSRPEVLYVTGNGVSNAGPFQSNSPEPAVQQFYDFIMASSNGSNIYWPSFGATLLDKEQGVDFFDLNDAPAPVATPAALPALIQENELGSIAPYLSSLSIRYVVIQNQPREALSLQFGVSNYTELESIWNDTPGVTLVGQSQDIALYRIGDVSSLSHEVDAAIPYNGSNTNYALTMAGFNSVGFPITVLPSMTNALGFESTEEPYDLMSPSFLAASSLPNVYNSTIPFSFYGQPTWTPEGSYHFTQLGKASWNGVNASAALSRPESTYLSQGDHWLGSWDVAIWNETPVHLSTGNGSVSLGFTSPSLATVSYNGTVAGRPGGVSVTNASSELLVINQTITYRTSANFSGKMSAFATDGVNTTSPGGGDRLSYVTGPYGTFPLSQNWNTVHYSTVAPLGTQFSTVRIEANASAGYIQMKNVQLNYSMVSIRNFSGTVVTPVPHGDNSLGPWTVTNWGANSVRLEGGGGAIHLLLNSTSTVTLSFNGTLAGSPGGYTVPNPNNQSAIMNLTFNYLTSPSFSGRVSVFTVYGTPINPPSPNDQNYSFQAGPQEVLPLSLSLKTQTFIATVPIGSKYAGVRIELQGSSGSVELNGVQLSIGLGTSDNVAPFGYDISLPNADTQFATIPNESILLNYAGSGTLNGQSIKSPSNGSFAWAVASSNQGLHFTGNLTLREALMAPSISWNRHQSVGTVWSRPFLPQYELLDGGVKYYPSMTMDFQMFFADPNGSSGVLIFGPQNMITAGYIVSVGWIAFLIAVVIYISRNSNSRNLQRFTLFQKLRRVLPKIVRSEKSVRREGS
jgi:hypothetical protein